MLLRSSLARLAVARGRLAAARFCTAAEETAYPTPQEVWEGIQGEARAELQQARGDDFGLPSYLKASVLAHDTLASGLSRTVGSKLAANKAEDSVDYESIITSAFEADPSILGAVTADLCRFKVVDPATTGLLGVFLFYKGVQALACARVAHHYWTERGGQGKLLARLLQSEMADVYGVDIHPGCTLGSGITIDHATGVTLGETCVIGDNVYIMHDVTLGATGNSSDFDRHPKVRARPDAPALVSFRETRPPPLPHPGCQGRLPRQMAFLPKPQLYYFRFLNSQNSLAIPNFLFV